MTDTTTSTARRMAGSHPTGRPATGPQDTVAPSGLRVEHLREPLGIGSPTPRLSWLVPDAPAGWSPTGADVELVSRSEGDDTGSSARVDGSGVLVAWPFAPLASRERAVWRVRVVGDDGTGAEHATGWSEPLEVEAGLLADSDWTASFVAAPWRENTRVDQAPPVLRRQVPLRGPVRRARLAVASLGLHEVTIDGVHVGDAELAPGWTSYGHRVRYLVHDVTGHLSQGGDVVLGARLADGWYRGRITWDDRMRNVYGDRLALIAQLEVEYEDGTAETFGTDDSWRAARAGILLSGLYDGEKWDGGVEPDGWQAVGFDDSDWDPVEVLDRPSASLVAADGPVVRVTEEIEPTWSRRWDAGAIQLDFGQNLPGRLRIRNHAVGPFGVTIRHAEVMQDDELATRPLRTAKATDVFYSGPSDDGTGTWHPRFTVHGFRYAEVEGWPSATLEPGDIVAEVLHSDMRRTGWFHCSDPRLERFHENVVWSMRGNFVDIPTDCPQRDERLGWSGDLQVFTPTAAFLYDCAGVLRSWLRDLALEQRPDGGVPHYVPTLPGADPEGNHAAVWGDVAVLTPWELYRAYGDVGLLEDQWASAKAWVDGVHATSDESLVRVDGFEFGDWLDPLAPPEDAAAAKADKYCLATAYSYRSTSVLAAWAGVLGDQSSSDHYAALASRIRDAWRERFLSDAGEVLDDSQASSALAIVFGLVDASGPVGERLAALVRANGHRIGTGFAGTPVVCDALLQAGHLDDAYAMLLQDECPSWLYPVAQGATTIWERWDSLLPDGRVNSGGMTSFNHYALGSVADFMHRVVAGIALASPGYGDILFAPRPGGGLTSAGAALDTPHGRAAIDWEVVDGTLSVTVTVPVGATAVLDLPGAPATPLAHGTWQASVPV
ncbi:alpha-L-rhamnosidase [Curtobacterium sp. PhB146]|uniref:alpha-L-rhamnosidase n=1 Tax=Curtobacterium sp. PhB146 TaxID=2485187 RepID=UPI0010CF3F2B|nr:alpha-L-rhamnosidase [Curtobacterium sp. PhB146]TCU48473.1 alpha-L-rhamnosidase [Curtobacterium sp. PhB146]